MTEAPVAGPVPRFELTEWRRRFRVVAGITGRGRGPVPFDLGPGGTPAPAGAVAERWTALRASLPEFPRVALSRQVHGTVIRSHDGDAAGAAEGPTLYDGVDGHLTRTPGLLLAITAADCIPVYLLDPVRRAIMLLHAGWRGLAADILPQGLALLTAQGSLVGNLLVHCGIGICGQCYEVGPEVFTGCGLEPPAAGRGMLDLRRLLARQALHAGVENVSTSQFCSRHDDRLFLSHRGSGGAPGRMVAYLGMLP